MQTLPGCTDVLRASGTSQSRRESRRTKRTTIGGRHRLPWISRPAITTAGEQSCRISEALLVPQEPIQLRGTLVFLVGGCHFASIFPAHSAAKHCPLAAVFVFAHCGICPSFGARHPITQFLTASHCSLSLAFSSQQHAAEERSSTATGSLEIKRCRYPRRALRHWSEVRLPDASHLIIT